MMRKNRRHGIRGSKPVNPRTSRASRSPSIEPLEARQLLSATYSVVGLPNNPLGLIGAFNDAGQVAGSTSNGGFLYSNGNATSFSVGTGDTVTVTGMNASGQVVGYGTAPSVGGVPSAFVYSAGTVTLIPMPAGTISSVAFAINNSGAITGNYVLQDNTSHGFVYANGKFTDIGTLGGSSASVNGINASGAIVGNSTLANGDTHAFLYSGGKIADIDPGGGNYSNAAAINDAGQIIGSDRTSAFLYAHGAITHLTAPAGGSLSNLVLNASGEVAGDATALNGQEQLFTYINGVMTIVGGIANSNITITGINNSGVIIGTSNENTLTSVNVPFLFQNGAFQSLNYDMGSLRPVQQEVGSANLPLQDFDFINNSGQIAADIPDFLAGQYDNYVLKPATAGSISGTVFHDANADGTQQSGEPGLAGLVVYDDETNSGSLNTGDPNTTTDANGHYTLANLPPGPAVIRFVGPTSNWKQSVRSLTLASGQNATNINFATLPIANFQVTDLGQLGGFETTATALNNEGQIVGYANTGSQFDPFLYTVSTGKFTDLTGVLGANVEINSINDSGQMVGTVYTGNVDSLNEPITKAFVYSGGKMTILPLPSGTDSASAVGINDSGQIVVLVNSVPTPDGPYEFDFTFGYVYSASTAKEVSQVPQGDTDIGALAINNAGQIFENAYEPPYKQDPGTGENFLDTNNTLVPITGSVSAPGPWFGNPIPATLGDTILAYDNRVGNPFPTGSFGNDDDLATQFYTGAQALNLNDALPINSGWTLDTADAINASDMIVGLGTNPQGRADAYLLTKTKPIISGAVFNDTNKDGIRDDGETGLAGVVVYEDPNYNHKIDAGEQSVTTDASGNFAFTNLPADPEILRVVLPNGATQTFPAAGSGVYVGKNVTQSLSNENFGVFSPGNATTGSIAGTVFNDLNEDGIQQAGEGGVDNVTVYVDLHNTGSFVAGDPSAITDVEGNYTISGLTPGKYTVFEIVPNGDEQFMPASNVGNVVTVSAGATVPNVKFALIVPKFPPNEDVSGTVFNDINRNGVQDPGETGIAGIVVYEDPNYNHKLDTDEQSTITDAQGNYDFDQLPADPEIIRVVLPSGATQTLPANGVGIYIGQNTGATLTGENFGVFLPSTITGYVYNDANNNGMMDNGEGVAGVTVYVDVNKTGSYVSSDPTAITNTLGFYSLAGLSAGTDIVREVVPTGYTQTSPANNAGLTENVNPSGSIEGQNFVLAKSATGETISGTVFNDVNKDGVQDNGETGRAGVVVYLDPNYNHKIDPGEQSVVTDANGNYTFTNVPADPEIVRVVLPSGATQSAPANGVGIYVGNNTGATLTNENFGVYIPSTITPSISGIVFNDANHDGIQDNGEKGIAGLTVYQDPNYSHTLDPNEQSAETDANGFYIFSNPPADPEILRLILNPGEQQTSPANGIGIYVGKIGDMTLTGENFGVFYAGHLNAT